MQVTKRFFHLWLGVFALLLAVILAACSPAATEQPSAQAPAPDAAKPAPDAAKSAPDAAKPAPDPGKPRQGGTFVFLGGTTHGADYHRATSINEIEMFQNVHLTLLELSAEDRETLQGDAAESWEASTDAKSYTFKIRKGLTTHKGKVFDAEDVAYSMNRMVERPNSMPVPRAGCLRAIVDHTEVIDSHTVVVHLKDPVASFLNCLTNPYLALQPKYVVEALDKADRVMKPEEIDGAGPFVMQRYVEGSIHTLTPFDNFYKEGKPYLEEIKAVALPDAASQVAAFRTGRIHYFSAFAVTPTVTEAKRLKKEFGDRITIQNVYAPGFRGFQLNYHKAPLDDIRVREAIDLAFDKQNHKELLEEGAAFFAGPYFGGWKHIYSFEEMSQWPGFREDKTADIKRAKELLAEAGYADGLTIGNVSCGTNEGDVCALLQHDMEKIGITLKLFRADTATRQGKARKGDFMMYSDSKGAEYDDPDVFNSLVYLPNAGLNWPKWDNKEFQALYEQQRVELDLTKRGQILRDMSDIIRDSHVYVFSNRPILRQTWWSFVKGFKPPASFYQTSYRWDHIWIDQDAPGYRKN